MMHAFTALLSKAEELISSQYERPARLYPALLALSPVVVSVVALYGEKLGWVQWSISTLLACGMLFLLAEFARTLGKAKEKMLWRKWGGMPSVQVLRHSDDTINVVSKAHYHSLLANKLAQPFPTREEESANPQTADALYTASCTWLRESTRNTKKFNLLFKDNISYGFRRNGFGIRPFGIAMAALALVWLVIRHGLAIWLIRAHGAPDPESFLSGPEFLTAAVALFMLTMWIWYFTENTVRDAAFSYAEKLVVACELLQEPAPTIAPSPIAPKASRRSGRGRQTEAPEDSAV